MKRRDFMKAGVATWVTAGLDESRQFRMAVTSAPLGARAGREGLPAGKPFASVEELFSKLEVHDIVKLKDGRLFMVYGAEASGAYSADGGKTWSQPFPVRDEKGGRVSPPLGALLESMPGVLGFRENLADYVFGWRRSTDNGRTWSTPAPINNVRGEARNPHANPRPFIEAIGQEMVPGVDRGSVLRSGRIIIPFAMALPGPISPEPGYLVGFDAEETLFFSFLVFSDDHGLTWKYSNQMIFTLLPGRYPADHNRFMTERGKGGFHQFEEPTCIEINDGKLMMFGRGVLGRTFASFSSDGGLNWHQPQPMPLASPDAPSLLQRLPNGDILLIWNQVSPEENLRGYSRHRLSTAVSHDGGKTWKHHRNLESLDDVSYIEPPPVETLHGVYGPHYDQPKDRKRYHRAPGVLRVAYPSARVLEDVVIISYGYGRETKRRVLPVTWFTAP